jgi:hypothetical protein
MCNRWPYIACCETVIEGRYADDSKASTWDGTFLYFAQKARMRLGGSRACPSQKTLENESDLQLVNQC